MSQVRSHYENLKVARTAPPEVVRAAYKVLAHKYHPDRNPGDREAARIMSLVNEAHRVLSDPELRRRHDEWIARAEHIAEAQAKKAPSPPPFIRTPPATSGMDPPPRRRSDGVKRDLERAYRPSPETPKAEARASSARSAEGAPHAKPSPGHPPGEASRLVYFTEGIVVFTLLVLVLVLI